VRGEEAREAGSSEWQCFTAIIRQAAEGFPCLCAAVVAGYREVLVKNKG